VTAPAAAPHGADVTACVRMGQPLPLVVLGVLVALGRTPDLPAELLEEIDAFFEAMEEPSSRHRAGFCHIPFWAEGDQPRRYACAIADGTAFTVFDLKTKALDPDTVSFPEPAPAHVAPSRLGPCRERRRAGRRAGPITRRGQVRVARVPAELLLEDTHAVGRLGTRSHKQPLLYAKRSRPRLGRRERA
jgi:hypothetical protein